MARHCLVFKEGTMQIKLLRLHTNARLPEYKTTHSSGADIYACLDSEVMLKPQEIQLIPTGFSMEIPEGYEAQIRPRSGLAVKGISVPNAPGTIDADYRGEVKIILINLGKEDFVIKNHDRIAQMIIARTEKAEFDFAGELTETKRGAGGFGSTGVGKK
jgi:dUTP pyrophosphatase